MNPILTSALFGLAKGLFGPKSDPGPGGLGYVGFLGPALEEIVYRGVPHYVTRGRAPMGLSAFGFAADHVRSEEHTPGSALTRFADVFAGGLLYEQAFKRFGILGAIASHSAHNLAIGLVQSAVGGAHTRRRAPPARKAKRKARR